MPTYQYACTACDERLEAVQSFTDAPLTECPACDGSLRKVFSAVGVVFKGSGFYKTDSRTKAGSAEGGTSETKAGGGTEKAGAASGGKGSDKGGDKGGSTASTGSKDSSSSSTASSTPAAASSAPASKSA